VTDSARLVTRVLHPRLDRGVPAVLLALLRAGTGIFFVSVSTGKFFDHAQEAVDFDRYGVPAADVAVYAVGMVELVGGLLLVVGLLTRPSALVLALNLIGAIATAGRVEGGSFHLGVAPTFLAICLLLTWLGSGRPGLDPLVERRLEPKSAV
jgi:putative oxidoreductase